MDLTWMLVGVTGSPRVLSSKIPREEDQVGPSEHFDALSPFNPLSKMRQKKRKENLWTDPIISILVLSSKIPKEEDQVGPCEQFDALSPFNPLSKMRQKKRKENPWTDPIISIP
ncbi:hypothetical protein ACH5RR_026175 [Cinchona calisaya]|uniref:Uncharacterized protein n=1 Tax=Cinchona calisaya TaxID=153742 RepID=A0ABD2Z2X3_9GENT